MRLYVRFDFETVIARHVHGSNGSGSEIRRVKDPSITFVWRFTVIIDPTHQIRRSTEIIGIEWPKTKGKQNFRVSIRHGKYSPNPGPAPPPPSHNFRQAQHQVHYSFLGPASGPAVYLFHIRPLMLNPAQAQLSHVRPSKKAGMIFGPASGPWARFLHH